ncbi:methyltransferase domain-containing protein [Pseudocnuella soli]|uniref:methyltransferase domain-containing protein n=1 Tax=Pseudocnuella soli TaxID=2502779 RepID=UPI001F02F390|nr:methyltransferase domain-containing protein [Pseudocnuella soli]
MQSTMNGTVHYTSCPVCGSAEINPLQAIKDFTVSGREFVLWQCAACSLRFTQDVPDAASIGAFYKSEDYISHTDDTKGLMNNLYQRVRRITISQKAKLIEDATGLKQGAILDVGCGTGTFLHHMKERGWKATGVEPDADARRMAKSRYGVEAQEPQALYEFAPQSFNAITLWHVLEHVHDLHPYMDRLQELLAPGGKLLIAVPNYGSLDAEVYRTNWAAYDVPRHLYHFTPRSMAALVAQHGLRIVAQKPMWFDAFYVSLLSSKYRNGKKPNWLHAGFTGIRSNLNTLLHPDQCSSLIYIIEKK